MKDRPAVTRQVLGKKRSGDITVMTTGSYSKNEYVEALFGVRNTGQGNVTHRARVVKR